MTSRGKGKEPLLLKQWGRDVKCVTLFMVDT